MLEVFFSESLATARGVSATLTDVAGAGSAHLDAAGHA